MKARNREINIFNMSLLDILCGALGAFCFMMLVLFPYYTPDTTRSKAPDLPKDFDPRNYEEAKNRVKQLEGALDQYKEYAEKLGRQASELKRRNDELTKQNNQLAMRNPVIAMADLHIAPKDSIQMWAEDITVGDDKKPPAKLDLTKVQDVHWAGDLRLAGEGYSTTYFMIRDTPRHNEFRISLKIIHHDIAAGPLEGWVSVLGTKENVWIPNIRISGERLAVPIAHIVVDDDNNQKMESIVPREYLPNR